MALFRNFRYSIRQLGKHPSFTATVVLTLALCIGANTAVFSVVDRLFFRPPPFPEPERLAVLTTVARQGGASEVDDSQTGLQWETVRDHASTLDAAVFGALGGINMVAGNRVEYVSNERVGANFFRVLGVRPLLGREFTPAEDVPGGPPLAIISFAVWQRVFHSAADVVGQTMELRGAPFTVIGVAPRGFVPPAHAIEQDAGAVDVWTPLHPTVNGEGSGSNYEIIARVKSGVSLAQVNAELNSIMRSIFDRQKTRGVSYSEEAVPLQTAATAEVRGTAELMWAAVGVVLLIGCGNIAGLLLARSISRSREIATRLALGASRNAIIGELLAECILLALCGGVLGVAAGKYGLAALVNLSPAAFEIWGGISLDGRVVTVMLLLSLITAVLFGLVPALQTTRVDVRSALSESGRTTAGTSRQWKRKALVFAEVSLSVVLVVSAALLIRTLEHLVSADPGFDPNHVLVASASLQDERYKTTAAGARLFVQSTERMQQIPGVESAAVASTPPYGRALNTCMNAIDAVPLTGFCLTNLIYATPGVFETLRLKLIEGSLFTERDTARTAPVAVVNRAFVHRYFGKTQPVGHSVRLAGKDWRILGVVADTQQKNSWGNNWGPIDTFPMIYVPVEQFPDGLFAMTNVWFSPVWIVRSRGEIGGLPQAMRQSLAAVDPRLPFSSFHSMEAIAGRSVRAQRYRATLFSVLAALATVLAAIGIYGVIAESVAQRTREMGIRLALGATIQNLVFNAALPGILLSGAGVLAGLGLGMAITRLLRSLIWGVPATDPLSFGFVALLLLAIASFASLLPALRLARIDPAQALRDE